MNTVKIYQRDVYQRECESTVVAITEKGLVLDQTIFFPTGGGQSCDKGTIETFPVLQVEEEEGIIYHQTQGDFSQGERVHCQLNWSHRFDNMQRHCGEHILSGIFYEKFGGVNRGFHMGEDYMTIDISLEENPTYTTLSYHMAIEAQNSANQVIWNNLPVTTIHLDDQREGQEIPLRKALTLKEDISIVCVGSVDNPADCVACCGTHPSTSGQVGLVKVYRIEKNKSMFRVYFEAGQRAFLDYEKKHDIFTQLSLDYSCTKSNFIEKYLGEQEKRKEEKQQLRLLRKELTSYRIKDLLLDQSIPLIREYSAVSIDDLMHVGKGAIQEKEGSIFLISTDENTLLLFSNGDFPCGEMVKKYAPALKGKGGGNSQMARVTFPTINFLHQFLNQVKGYSK